MNPALRLPPLPTIKDIIKLYRLRAVKQLSQNFLLDQGVTGRIVKRCGKISPVSEVLEVGPGPGSITRSIIRKLPKRIILVEKDERFKPTLDMLGEAFSLVNGKLETIYDDIRDVKLDKVFSQELKKDWHDCPPNIHIVGNLPFSISTNLIIRWLHDISEKKGAWALGRVKMTLTFQKEVAERLVSEICGEQRCRLSVMAQTWTKPKLEFIIPGNKFVPKPNVDVGVVTFTPLKIPFTNHEFTLFEKVNRHLFCFRQKYNQKCAGTLFPPEKRDSYVQLMYDIAGVNPHIRSFQLSLEDIDKLITAYKKICAENPEIVMYNHYASRKVVSKTLTKEITVDEYFDDMEEENEDEFENPNEYEEDREEKIFSGI